MFFRANTDNGSIHFQADDGSGGLAGYMDIDGQNEVIDIFKDIQLTATKKLYFDTGGANTYIVESADDILDFYAGAALMLRLDETNNIVSIPQDAAGATFIMGDTATWEQYVDGNDVVLRNKVSTGHIRMLTDNSVENIRMIDTEVTINEGSADIDFRVESNGEANMLFVDGGSNNVIIGNNAPIATLGGTGAFQVLGTGGGDTLLTIGRFSANASAPKLEFAKSRNGTIGGNTIVQDGDSCGEINWIASDGSDMISYIAQIEAEVDGTPGSNDTPGRLMFKTTADGASGATEHFRISQDGALTATDTSIGSISDKRIKKDIKNFTGGLELISKLTPRTFKYRSPEIHFDGVRRGFIAQEVQAVDEYWIDSYKVLKDNEDYQYVKDTEGKSFASKLTDKDAMYVSAIQELKREIDELKLKLGK